MNADLVAALATAGVSLILGLLSFFSARRSDRAEKDRAARAPANGGRQAEAGAYGRAASYLEEALAACQQENDRLRGRLARHEPPDHDPGPDPGLL